MPGNIASDAIHVYSYDADGNLISVDNGQTARYYYDSLNQRVQVAPTRGTYEFVWDAFGRRVSTWAASNHGFVESNAYTDSAPVAIRAGGSTQFEHQNWLGTERVRTSYNGAVLLSINSLPWADGHTPSGDNGDQHDFARMERDLEDNTEHAQFRQYSTNLGRWQSPDLYLGSYDFTNPQSFNRYTYALNNPSSLIDPSGLDCSDNNGTDLGDDGTGGIVVGGGCSPPSNPPPSQPGNWCGGVAWGTEGCIQPPCGYPGVPPCSGPSSIPDGPTGPPRTAILSNAPINGQTSCVGGVLADNAVGLGLDLLGTLPIPEVGGITRLVGQQLGAAKIGAIYRGVVADQKGANFLNGLRNSTSAGALFGNASDTSGLGLASTAVGGAALTAGYFVPVLGQILSGGQLLIDSIHTYNTIQAKCYGHS